VGAEPAESASEIAPAAPEPLRRNRDFATLLISQTISGGGDAVSATAMPLLVLALTGSGLVMGLVGAVASGADFLMGTVAGAYADRGDRKRMMLLADVGRAVLTALVPLSDIVHGPTIAVILLIAGPLAILRAFFRAGYLSSMPNLVGRSQLARGNGILESAYSTSFIVAPAIAAFLVTSIGPGPTLAVDALSFAVSATGLFFIRRELKAPPHRAPSRIVDDIREGIVYVARDPILRTMILLFASAATPLIAIGPAMTFRLVRDLGMEPAAFGLTLSGLGFGTLVGALLASRLGPETNVARVLVGAVLLMGLPIAATAVVSWLPAIVLLTALSGAGEAALVIVYVSVRAAHSPDALVGRIASTSRTITLGLAPFGALIGGILIDAIGGTRTLAVAGTATCVVALAFSRVDALHRASLAPPISRPAGDHAPLEPVLPISEGIER
jgi:MFS family permease